MWLLDAAEEADIDELVSSAPEVELLDKAGLKRLIVNFERKMNQNQVHRMKFADQPSKCAGWASAKPRECFNRSRR